MPPKAKSSEEKKPAVKPITKATKRHLTYKFNNEELLAIGKDLAEKNGQLGAIEQDKKRVVADFTAKISGMEAEISIAANKIQSGYEYRDIPCTVTMHTPETGRKTIVRDDTKETVCVEDMNQDELQQELLPANPEALQ